MRCHAGIASSFICSAIRQAPMVSQRFALRGTSRWERSHWLSTVAPAKALPDQLWMRWGVVRASARVSPFRRNRGVESHSKSTFAGCRCEPVGRRTRHNVPARTASFPFARGWMLRRCQTAGSQSRLKREVSLNLAKEADGDLGVWQRRMMDASRQRRSWT
jgi:hypothetical protein